MDFDFGYNGAGNATDGNAPDGNAVSGAVTDIDDGSVNNDVNGSKADNLDGKSQEPATQEPNDTNEPSDNTKPAHDLEVGTSIEVGDVTYTIDKNGNVIKENLNQEDIISKGVNTLDEICNEEPDLLITPALRQYIREVIDEYL